MRRLVSAAWLARHALAVVLIGGFLALGWWQISRALSGNALSWAYAVEWPIFAGFVAVIWLREARRAGGRGGSRPTATSDRPRAPAGTSPYRRPVLTARRAPADADPGPDDPQLIAYNHYLAWLSAHPAARPADYPGPGDRSTAKGASWAQPSSGTG